VVLQPDAPQISLSGVGPHLARPAPEFEGSRGVPLFPELRIVCSLSHAVNTAAQGMEGGGESSLKGANFQEIWPILHGYSPQFFQLFFGFQHL